MKRTSSFHPVVLCLALFGLALLPIFGCIATADLPDTETAVINPNSEEEISFTERGSMAIQVVLPSSTIFSAKFVYLHRNAMYGIKNLLPFIIHEQIMYQNNRLLFLLPLWLLIILVAMFIAWYFWLGPGYEPGPVFPIEPYGQFIQPIAVDRDGENIVARWSVESVCKINEIEIQEAERAGEFGWMGGTADCIQDQVGSTCRVDLSNRELVKGVNYRLQANSDQCSNGEEYVSEVVEFSF